MNLKEAYKEGFKDGLIAYAWWKDGTQYVGIREKLKNAINNMEKSCFYEPPKENELEVEEK